MTKPNEDTNTEYASETGIPKGSIHDSTDVTLQIKEEQLQIVKNWLQTGEVKIYRDSFLEEKSFIIPVECEELVIEKKTLVSVNQKPISQPTEVIRIRLSEEHVEFTKHKFVLEDVSIYKQEIEEIKHIEETLKKEEVRVKISGSAKIRDELTT